MLSTETSSYHTCKKVAVDEDVRQQNHIRRQPLTIVSFTVCSNAYDRILGRQPYFIEGTGKRIDVRPTPVVTALKETTSQTDYYLVNLSSKTYVFEDKLTKY